MQLWEDVEQFTDDPGPMFPTTAHLHKQKNRAPWLASPIKEATHIIWINMDGDHPHALMDTVKNQNRRQKQGAASSPYKLAENLAALVLILSKRQN